MEVTAKRMRLRDLYLKTAKRHNRRWKRYESEDSKMGEEARRRRDDLRRYAQELGLKPSHEPDEGAE